MRRTALLAFVLLAGCGSAPRSTPGPRAQLDPPRAAEPVAAPPVEGTPPGRVVRVGAKPEGVAVDPVTHLAAVAVESPPALVLVDVRTGRVTRRVPLPGNARHVALARPGGPFLVPAETANALVEVDPRTGDARTTKVGDHPHDATAVGARVFTADEFGSTLSVVRGGRRLRSVPVDAQPGGVAAVDGKVAVVGVRAYTVELFGATDDPRGGGGQSAGLGPSHVVVGPAGRLGIADTRGQALVVYDTRPKLRFRARVPLGGTPVGIAGDPRRGVVWAALSERNRVVPVDLRGKAPKLGPPVRTVRNPFSVGVDPVSGRLAIASRTAGTLQLVTPVRAG
ncbi:MAG: YncE family protein [Solirubrobacteraceae bacterium]